MKYTVEIPVKISKSNGTGLMRGVQIKLEVAADDETLAKNRIRDLLQNLLDDQVV